MPVRFQVDADFYDHPKSIGLSDAATALWVRAGSYSAAKLTDGFIAEHVLPTLSKVPQEAADELRRRGLWLKVRGGFRFHQWDQRNLTRARVETDRAHDRDRKKRTRQATRQDPPKLEDAQVKGQNVRPESARTPPGFRPESGESPPVSVSVSVSESVSGSGRLRGVPAHPPPLRCSAHLDDPDPPPCGACGDRRRARDQWDRDQVAAAAEARQAEARSRAEATRLAVDACGMCDDRGYVGRHLCAHDPHLADRTKTGAAEARAAIIPIRRTTTA